METGEDEVAVDAAAEWHRAQAVECNNGIWDLVGKVERSGADDEEMLRRADSSAYHWQRARGAGPANEARALYMLAKVHLLTGQGARSLHYADACLGRSAGRRARRVREMGQR